MPMDEPKPQDGPGGDVEPRRAYTRPLVVPKPMPMDSAPFDLVNERIGMRGIHELALLLERDEPDIVIDGQVLQVLKHLGVPQRIENAVVG